MTEQYRPKVDDRIRATVEGVVIYVSKYGCDVRVTDYDVDGAMAFVPVASYDKVEKLGPNLPTMPGSVVRLTDGSHYLLGFDYQWRGRRNRPLNEMTMRSFNFDIIFDAGVTSDRNNQEEK